MDVGSGPGAMSTELAILIAEAMVVYFLVLGAHALRRRFGLAHFYALIGGLTAIMSWVTDAGVSVELGEITFMVGSTVFYTSLLLGVFVVYVFDGPRATRIAISTVAGVSAMVPVIALVLHLQIELAGSSPIGHVPVPSLRINFASVLTTIADLVFLAIAWEFLGKPKVQAPLWMRAFLTLLGVMWLDVLLFNTGAFLGTERYLEIMTGTFLSRSIIALFAYPFLYLYLHWQHSHHGIEIQNRPVMAILQEISHVQAELSIAQQDIERRKQAEAEKEQLIAELQQALAEVRTLRSFLPICAGCKKIRDVKGCWHQIEQYLYEQNGTVFSHGLCPDCVASLYPTKPDSDDQGGYGPQPK